MNKRSDSVLDLADTFLGCRDKGHHWHHVTDEITLGTRKRVREIRRYYECKGGCGTKQTEIISLPDCQVQSRTYTYPDGYLVTREPGTDPVRVADIRREVFGRQGLKF